MEPVEPIPEFMQKMYAHFDFETPIDSSLVHKLNSTTEHCSLHYHYSVHDQAHSRFDATKRTYRISILLKMLSDRNTVFPSTIRY
jgi:tRNA U38,U39,U40 pseudouridine synthase TruA